MRLPPVRARRQRPGMVLIRAGSLDVDPRIEAPKPYLGLDESPLARHLRFRRAISRRLPKKPNP
jgi:hypothetical protein